MFLWTATLPIARGRRPSASQFGGFLFFCLCLLRLTQNDHVRQVNTYTVVYHLDVTSSPCVQGNVEAASAASDITYILYIFTMLFAVWHKEKRLGR